MAWLESLSLGLSRRLPVILQTEAAECGLACLAMVLGHHGVITDLAALRARHAISLKGMTLTHLAEIAVQENLGYRAVRLDLGDLAQIRLPAILHWDLNHFVVLKSVSANAVVVHDPNFGERRYSMQEASKHFTGVALELWPNPGFTKREEKTPISLGHLIGQVSGFWPSLAQILLLSLVLQLFVLLSPQLMQTIVDNVVVSRDVNLLTTLALGFGLLLLMQQLIGLIRSWLLLTMSTSIRIQWKANVFSHLLKLPLDYFSKRHLGDIVSRTSAIEEIQRVLTSVFIETLFDGLMVILTLIMMFIYNPTLAWISIGAVSIYLLLRLIWYRPLYLATEEQIVHAANLSTHFLETLRGMRAIKLFSRQEIRKGTWQTLLVNETNATLSIQKLQIWYRLFKSTLSGLTNIALLWLGASQVLAGNLSLGMLVAFLAYRGQFDSRVTGLIDQFIEFKMLQLYGQRLADVVLTPAETGNQRLLGHTSGAKAPEIRFESLRFRYAEQDPWVIDGFDLTIPPGSAIAITGSSGCGKTTLVNLLMGVLKPTTGSIFIGSAKLEQIGSDAWRGQVGTVMQDDVLFSGSIAENICFFDPRPDLEQIMTCAKLAAIAEDIESMPMSYQTLVGDMGTVLSGGQKQRVLLARALYKQPQVLILDEATSHLDLKRESQVNASIAALSITRVVIAHRPETIAAAQRVIEMSDGTVAYDGPPEGYFARMSVLTRRTPSA